MNTKLILDQNTSFEAISRYFEDINPGSRVRARDLGDGRIELYVRKDSLKQFFTDKLRPDFLVKRDYQAAKTRIFEIIDKIDPAAKNSTSPLSIYKKLNDHKHDFVVNSLNSSINFFLRPQGEISNAKIVLNNHWKAVNVNNYSKQLISGEQGQKCISKIINAVEDFEDRKILQRNFEALNTLLFCDGPPESPPTVFEYRNAIDFSRAWLKELPGLINKTNSADKSHTEDIPSKEDSVLISLLTDFSKRIAIWSAAGAIDYQGGEVGNSYADLVIIDPAFSPIIFQSLSNDNAKINLDKNYESDSSEFMLSSYRNVQTSGAKDNTDGLKIIYAGMSAFDEEKIEDLYKNIGIAIDEKMREKIASAKSGSIMEASTADQLYVVHLPVLNPFENEQPSKAEKSMMVEAFVKATVAWTEQYPNLRIKVQLPQTISENDINLAALNMSDRSKARAEYQKMNNPQ